MKDFTFYCFDEPKIGWLEVPVELIRRYNVKDVITSDSYIDGSYVYLETKVDAVMFLDKLREWGVTFSIVHDHDWTFEDSDIREYTRYDPKYI